MSAAIVGFTLYVAQIAASKIWLGHFRFGPFEWLWRSLSYGKWQPLTRPPHTRPAATF